MQIVLPSGWTFDSSEVQCACFLVREEDGKDVKLFTIIFKGGGNMRSVDGLSDEDIRAYYSQIASKQLLEEIALTPGHDPIFDDFVLRMAGHRYDSASQTWINEYPKTEVNTAEPAPDGDNHIYPFDSDTINRLPRMAAIELWKFVSTAKLAIENTKSVIETIGYMMETHPFQDSVWRIAKSRMQNHLKFQSDRLEYGEKCLRGNEDASRVLFK